MAKKLSRTRPVPSHMPSLICSMHAKNVEKIKNPKTTLARLIFLAQCTASRKTCSKKWRGKKELEDFDIWFKIINKFCRITWFHIPCYTNMILILLLHLFLLQMLDFILEFYNTRLFVLELLNHVCEAILKQISCTYRLNPSHIQVIFKQMIYKNYIYREFTSSIGIDVLQCTWCDHIFPLIH